MASSFTVVLRAADVFVDERQRQGLRDGGDAATRSRPCLRMESTFSAFQSSATAVSY